MAIQSANAGSLANGLILWSYTWDDAKGSLESVSWVNNSEYSVRASISQASHHNEATAAPHTTGTVNMPNFYTLTNQGPEDGWTYDFVWSVTAV